MELQTISDKDLHPSSQPASPSQVIVNEAVPEGSGVAISLPSQASQLSRASSRERYAWVSDSYPTYRLSKNIVEGFLTEKFGEYDFRVTLRLDEFEFVVPRRLSDEEREALGLLRLSKRRRGRLYLRNSTPSPPRVAQETSIRTLEEGSGDGFTALDRCSEDILQQTCPTCGILVSFWILIPLASVAIGFWRSFATGDEGKGFTDAAFVVAAGGMIMYPVQRMHNRKCRLRTLAE